MVAKIRPIMSSTYITLGSRTASPYIYLFYHIDIERTQPYKGYNIFYLIYTSFIFNEKK